jgi:PilZ domain-containing protein
LAALRYTTVICLPNEREHNLATTMTFMNSPQTPPCRDIRYPLNLPVSLKLAHKEMCGRSENISLGGILLSSAFLIPEGSAVEVEVEVAVARVPYRGTQLSARGKVLRVRPKATGDFAVAIAFDTPFEFALQSFKPDSTRPAKIDRIPRPKNSLVGNSRLHFAAAWHTET